MMSALNESRAARAFDPGPWIAEAHLRAGLRDRPHTLSVQLHANIVARVARMYRTAIRDAADVEEPYRSGGEWAVYVAQRRALYCDLLAGRLDAAGERLAHFWRNDHGPIVKEYARYDQLVDRLEPFSGRFQRNVVRNFLIWRELLRRSPAELAVPDVGNPWGYMIDDQLVAPKATRFHALAVQATEIVRDVHSPLVAEIGGGYGGFAYYLLRDFPRCGYVGYDLPETLVLASYYLLCALPERPITLYGEEPAATGDAAVSGAVLLPHFMLPARATNSVDLLVNTFSLSEVPWSTLEAYIGQIQRIVRGYFLHHNMDRPGVVNRGHERIPASTFPIDPGAFKLLARDFDQFHGHDGDYRQFLYQRTRMER